LKSNIGRKVPKMINRLKKKDIMNNNININNSKNNINNNKINNINNSNKITK
jgi:hypothetical protein